MKRIGIFTAVLMGMAAASAQTPSSSGSVLAASGGRFAFGQISEYRRDQFLLDVQSGRLWVFVCAKSNKEDPKQCDAMALQPVPFLNGSADVVGYAPSTGK